MHIDEIQRHREAKDSAMRGHDANYNTRLSPSEEKDFAGWKAKNAPNDSGVDYDLRGAYKAHLEKDIKSGHWSDRFKKPNHPTFSDQSQYAKEAPEKAGHWNGDVYVKPQGRK